MKNKIFFAVTFSVMALGTIFLSNTQAQEFNIPEPTCVDTPEIPCPGKGRSYDQAQKPAQNINYNAPEGFSKISGYLKNLSRNIGNLIDKTFEDIKNWFGNVYDNLYENLPKLRLKSK